jgi:hypothetical protein
MNIGTEGFPEAGFEKGAVLFITMDFKEPCENSYRCRNSRGEL